MDYHQGQFVIRMVEIPEVTKRLELFVTQGNIHCLSKSGYSKKFFKAHRDEITLHKAVKEAFSKLPDGKIPRVKYLNEEFARLLSEKKSAYSEYRKINKEMQNYQITKQNVEFFYAAQQSWDIEEDMKKKRQQQR